MKLLVMCEGPNEREVINILLEHDLLEFTEDDLLGLTTYHAKQIKSSAQVRTELNIYPGKVKSDTKPKTFAKQHIRCGRKRYDNSTAFYREYFGNNVNLLVQSILEYKRLKGTHKKDELYLADLLRLQP